MSRNQEVVFERGNIMMKKMSSLQKVQFEFWQFTGLKKQLQVVT